MLFFCDEAIHERLNGFGEKLLCKRTTSIFLIMTNVNHRSKDCF